MAPSGQAISQNPESGFRVYSRSQDAAGFGGFDYNQTLEHPLLRYQVMFMAAAMANISLYAATGYVRNTRTGQFIYIDHPPLDPMTARKLADELAATGRDLLASRDEAYRAAGEELLNISGLLAGNDRTEALRQVFFFRNFYPGAYPGPRKFLYGRDKNAQNYLGNRLWSYLQLATGNLDSAAYMTVLNIMQVRVSWPD